jgi:hypothetical protein
MGDNDILTATPDQHLHDLRAVHDMGDLRVDLGQDTADRLWYVLRVTPDPHSGSTTLVGAAIDGKTGELIDSATGKPAGESSFPSALIQEGSWTLMTRIGAPRGKQRGRYKWIEPLQYRKRKLDPEDIYRPFSKGGVVLCRHNPKLEGAEQFDSVNLLPAGWESDVRSAFDALQKNKALSSAPASSADIASLRALPNDNPIVSSIAFRSLAETGNLDSETLQQGFSKSSGYLRAVFMYVVLIHSPVGALTTLEAALTQAAQSTSQPSDSRAVALASTAAALFHPELPVSSSLSSKLLSSIRSRPIPSIAGHQSDPYVDQLLKLTQIP